jgi:hypothetical protein
MAAILRMFMHDFMKRDFGVLEVCMAIPVAAEATKVWGMVWVRSQF